MRAYTENKSSEMKKRKNDIVFIAGLLLVVSLIGLFMLLKAENGDTVMVTIDKKMFGEYSLLEDRVVEIRSGDALNILVIRDGYAYVETASCPDGICASHRPIFRDGESIICKPNKVVIAISATNKNVPDIVA